MDTTNTKNTYFLIGAVIVGALFVAGAILWGRAHPTLAPEATSTPPTLATTAAQDPFIGSVDAPLAIYFWSDYQCPFCKALEVGGIPQVTTPPALPQIIKDYVDTGKVKIILMDYVFLGNDSITDAAYGRAVWKLYPSQYFTWRTAMYQAQDAEGDQGFGNAASVDALNAKISGIDAAAVAADVQANLGTYQAMMDADKAAADQAGVTATPTFLIGTQVIAGAYPYATFQSAIDALLK